MVWAKSTCRLHSADDALVTGGKRKRHGGSSRLLMYKVDIAVAGVVDAGMAEVEAEVCGEKVG